MKQAEVPLIADPEPERAEHSRRSPNNQSLPKAWSRWRVSDSKIENRGNTSEQLNWTDDNFVPTLSVEPHRLGQRLVEYRHAKRDPGYVANNPADGKRDKPAQRPLQLPAE